MQDLHSELRTNEPSKSQLTFNILDNCQQFSRTDKTSGIAAEQPLPVIDPIQKSLDPNPQIFGILALGQRRTDQCRAIHDLRVSGSLAKPLARGLRESAMTQTVARFDQTNFSGLRTGAHE